MQRHWKISSLLVVAKSVSLQLFVGVPVTLAILLGWGDC